MSCEYNEYDVDFSLDMCDWQPFVCDPPFKTAAVEAERGGRGIKKREKMGQWRKKGEGEEGGRGGSWGRDRVK